MCLLQAAEVKRHSERELRTSHNCCLSKNAQSPPAQRVYALVDFSRMGVITLPAIIGSAGGQSVGGKWRTNVDSVPTFCRRPQEMHIDPSCCFSVSREITLSRTASEAATTGPSHLSQR